MQDGRSPKTQPFSEHVRELQIRLILVASTLFAGSVLGYILHNRLFQIVRRPLNEQLYYTTPTGGFNALIKISILFGILVTVPVFVYQVGKFLRPALRRYMGAVRIILFSSALMVAGVLFAYFISLPAALHFLSNISSEDLQSLLTINEYLNFIFGYTAGFALLFQLPLILLFINRIKPQNPRRLMKHQRFVVLFSFVIAAILTPTPDPMNQVLMAAPIILLYQFSVGLIWLVNRRDNKRLAKAVPVATPAPNPAMKSAPALGSLALRPIPQTSPPVVAPNPKLIMDIYWAPNNSTTAL
ncbi:MAG TPA: twin-arginine translocase subunit TatC [Candidatus Saccharimonadales bacterium]|nr:twin-arginine translocase subunit TatC [Candidatus Saccharimonadales bacterium]